MTGYERIMNAIEGNKTDRVAVWPFVMAFSAKYAGIPYKDFCLDYKKLCQAQYKTCEDFEFDAVTIDSDAYREASACGAILTYPEDDLPTISQHAITDKSKFTFKLPNIANSPRLMDKIYGVAAAKEYFKKDKAVCGWVESPFQSASTLYDLNDFLIDIYEEPEFIKQLLEYTTELSIAFAIEQAKAGADIIGVGDAMASLVSKNIYNEFVAPTLKKLVAEVKKNTNVKIKHHICGDASHILPFSISCGFDIVNIDYKVDMKQAFDISEGRICIKGNLDPVGILKDGSIDTIVSETKKLIDLNQPKFILSPGCEVPKDTPYDNLRAMVYCLRD